MAILEKQFTIYQRVGAVVCNVHRQTQNRLHYERDTEPSTPREGHKTVYTGRGSDVLREFVRIGVGNRGLLGYLSVSHVVLLFLVCGGCL